MLTSVDNTATVNVFDGTEDGSNKTSSVPLEVVALCTNAIEQFTPSAEIEDEV